MKVCLSTFVDRNRIRPHNFFHVRSTKYLTLYVHRHSLTNNYLFKYNYNIYTGRVNERKCYVYKYKKMRAIYNIHILPLSI